MATGAAVFILGTMLFSVSSVPAGRVGLVRSFGAIKNQVGEGLQWTLPWQTVQEASIQTQGHKFEKMNCFSIETQSVTITATVNARVSPDGIQKLYRDVGHDYFNVLVQPRILQAFKDETVKYSSTDIAPSREAIRVAVRKVLEMEMANYPIVIQDLLIDDIAFGEKFALAIEEKQTQSQLSLAEREKVGAQKAKADQEIEKARGTAESTLILANKQAEANRTLAQSITPEFVQYTLVTKLAPNVSVMMIQRNERNRPH